MTFSSMIVFMIKWALAAIPALLILGLLAWLVVIIFTALFAAAIHSVF